MEPGFEAGNFNDLCRNVLPAREFARDKLPAAVMPIVPPVSNFLAAELATAVTKLYLQSPPLHEAAPTLHENHVVG
jgi:hypothetical protein